MKKLLLILLIFFMACSLEPPAEREYIPFLLEKMPEERKYYPEETMVFIFNMDIEPNTLSHFKATGKGSKTSLEAVLEANKIIVFPPLPQDDELEIVIGSGLKSVDYKPLFIDFESPSKTGKIEVIYQIGKKVPELLRFLPESGESATVALSFDGEVDLSSAVISPTPEIGFAIEEWVFLSYSKPENKIILSGLTSVERGAEINDITIILEGAKPFKSELVIDYLVNDVECNITISDENALAVDIDGVKKLCEKRCSVRIEGLNPLTQYNSNITVYAADGRKKEKLVFKTDSEQPKIMITEIMHTPSKEPEKSWEFVEIYNYGNLDFDLADCFIDDSNNNKGIDPLILKYDDRELMLRPGEIAVITGNEAAFGDLIGNALWLVTKDTTIADGGLTSKETVQIKCKRNDVMVTEADEDPKKFSTKRGYSFTVGIEGSFCASSIEGGTPGRLEKCPLED